MNRIILGLLLVVLMSVFLIFEFIPKESMSWSTYLLKALFTMGVLLSSFYLVKSFLSSKHEG